MKKEISEKEYANICLTCPNPTCIFKERGGCDRVNPYTPPRLTEYETAEKTAH